MSMSMQDYLTNDYKVYINVTEIRTKDGQIKPLSFEWVDGTVYEVDDVLDVRPGHSLKAGGYGMRYTVSIRGRERYMFLEEDKWFMERK